MIGAVSATSNSNDTNLGSDLTDDSIKHTANNQIDKTSSTNDAIIKEDTKIDEKSSTNYAIVTENKDKEKRLITNKENDIIKNGEPKSFKELDTSIQDNISSGKYIINLESNYKYIISDGEDLKNGITIDTDSITINGNGHTIDGNNIARIFYIISKNVILKNITFSNGNATDYGGAIYWQGDNGYINNCNFTNNYAKFGGVIFWGDPTNEINPDSAKNGTVINSNFTNNNAMLGGAIYWFANEGNIINSYFKNNSVNDDGGAIYWYGENGTIKNNCDFIENIASGLAGAVYWYGENGTITNNCNFINNKAYSKTVDTFEVGGGAIYWQGDNGTITNNCSFINNTACSDTDSQQNFKGGGAIHFISTNNYVSACIFVNNFAKNHGGAIWCDNCVISNCIFLNNTADYDDTIYANTSLKANYNWFGHNTSNYNESVSIKGYNCDNWLFLNVTSIPNPVPVSNTSEIIFELKSYNKTSNKISNYNNNLLYPVNLKVSPKLGSIDKNIARLNETIRYTAPNTAGQDNVTASIENVIYTFNLTIKQDKEEVKTEIINLNISSLFEGKPGTVNGTLYAKDEGLPNQKIIINITNTQGHNETYNGTTDSDGKFSIIIRPHVNGEVTITINYPGNQTKQFIYKPINKTNTQNITSKTSFKYLNQEIQEAINNNKNNISLKWDYRYDNTTDYEFIKGIPINDKFTIYGNNHTINGSGKARILTVTNGNLIIDQLKLINGQGQYEEIRKDAFRNLGGAIYLNESSLTLINSDLNNNNATYGGAISPINYSNVTIINSKITHNNASYSSGAIFTYINCDVTIINSKLNNNNATDFGGAILAFVNCTVNIISSQLTNNSARYGGAIYASNNSNISITNTILNSNQAEYGGATGAITNSKINLNNCTINNNLAKSSGGAIYTRNSTLNINNTQFTSNNATEYGGVIITKYNDISITNSILQNNKASKGSAIHIITGTLTTINTKLINNTIDGENYHIKHKDSKLNIETITDITEGTTLTIKITADTSFNDKVTLIINEKNYTVQIDKGLGQINISNLNPGTYTAKVIFKGNENYTEINITSNSFKVNSKPVNPTPSPSNPTVNPRKNKYPVKIYLTLKKVKKVFKNVKKLYLKVVVKRNSKKLITKTITLKVKKVKNKKSAPNRKTKKLTKVQSFKFSAKIKGQTYTKKTNKKGKATFKITNLNKKGTYTAKITYQSKKYYKKSAKIKFKIKK